MAAGLAERQLDAIAETLDLAQQLGAEIWLRGGWAMNFFLGDITRDHADVDRFAWSHEALRLADALTDHGYTLLTGAADIARLAAALDRRRWVTSVHFRQRKHCSIRLTTEDAGGAE